MEFFTVDKILTSCGALLLLCAWLTQQFLNDKWNSRLVRLAAARAAFQAYQSNNALFNAFVTIAPNGKEDDVRKLQMQNYRFGLQELREALPEGRLRSLDSRIKERAKERSGYADPEMALMQGELEVIQEDAVAEALAIRQAKSNSQMLFSGLYICGSLLALVGTVFK
jgi:hypothetical protein